LRPLEFGWLLPTHGDTTAYGVWKPRWRDRLKLCEQRDAGGREAALESL